MFQVNDELQRLENYLRLLKGFLAKKQAERLKQGDLERQIKELVYDVEDIRESWFIHRAAANNSYSLARTLTREIVSITHDRLEPMCRMIRAYTDLQVEQQQPVISKQVPLVQLNREVPPMRLKKIVGFEDEANTLISFLKEETEELDVVCITGMPGIGKTALAWKIYQNETIIREFPTRIWVHIPHDISGKDLYLDILKEFIKQGIVADEKLVNWLDIPQQSCSKSTFHLDILNLIETGRIKDTQLIHAARACMEQRRFLLVMDDVWDPDTLESMRYFLPRTGNVLITTRNNLVPGKPHVLRFLNEEESWDMLQLEVFGKLGECPEILKSRGKYIAKKCDGSPLAIAAVGTSLGVASSTTVAAKYFNEQWWKKVSENVMVHATCYDQQSVISCIESSYIKLTQCLQDCFLYLGVFPQGHEIPFRTLIQLWIAERLVRGSRRASPEETAEQTLHDLIDRNLVMVKIYPNRQIKTCRLHKVMYGFCKYKAAEQGFYHEIKMSGDHLISLAPNNHRLCIYSCLLEFFACRPNGHRIHSILCLNKEDKVVLHPKHSSTIHKCFKLIRVLECRYIKFTQFPNELTTLMLLRYITLSCDDLHVIPETISSLCYLETLVVDTQSPSLQFKASIWGMLRLRHLVTKAAITIAIRGTGEAGKNLQTLTRLAPTCCTEDVFRRARNMKTLGIRGDLAALSDPKFFRILKLLENMKLINESAPDIQIHGLLRSNCFPANLRRLTLSGTWLKWECMSILAGIDRLEILKLKNNAFRGESWSSSHNADGFRGLGFLSIHTADLESWDASAGCFPNLKRLVLENCQQLHQIPATLANSLDTLDVKDVPQSAHDSAKQIEQEIATRQQPQNRS